MSRQVLARRETPRLVLPRRGGTIVGVSFSNAAWQAKIQQLDSDIFNQDAAVDTEIRAIKSRASTGATTEMDRKVIAWLPNWTAFKLDWSTWKAGEPWALYDNEIALYNYQMRYRQLAAEWAKFITAAQPAAPPSPTPDKPKTFFEDAGGFMSGTTDLVKLGLLVVGGYFAYKFVKGRGSSPSAPSEPATAT